jgi:hypothetical protein
VNSLAKTVYAWFAGGTKIGLLSLAGTLAALTAGAFVLFALPVAG